MDIRKVVVVRTGQHVANTKGIFCGWLDSPLSQQGREEAKAAGKYLKKSGIHFDMMHSSLLCRATETLNIVMSYLNQRRTIIHKHWRLNERHYGKLTGMKRYIAAQEYGKEQVLKWEFSYENVPPPMDENHKYYSDIVDDIRYRDGPSELEMPQTESLKMTFERFLPHWDSVIIPQLRLKKTILMICHGDVMRCLVKFLNRISDEEIENVNFIAGVPMVLELDKDFNPCKPMYFLAEGRLDKAMVDLQAKRKEIIKF